LEEIPTFQIESRVNPVERQKKKPGKTRSRSGTG